MCRNTPHALRCSRLHSREASRHNDQEAAKHTIPEDGEDSEGEKSAEYDERRHPPRCHGVYEAAASAESMRSTLAATLSAIVAQLVMRAFLT